MRYLILLFLCTPIFASSLAVYAPCDKAIAYPAYTVCYDNKSKGPVFSSYTITPLMMSAPVDSDRPGFHQDKHIDKQYRAANSDYKTEKGKLYDKGHLAPKAALDYIASTEWQTFSLANTAPQIINFNRQLWPKVERSVRELAKSQIVSVVSGVCYPGNPNTLGKHGISIPEAFFKLVQYGEEHKLYYVHNTPHKNKNIDNYLIPVEHFNIICRSAKIK